jgi:hypothetical protein
MNVHQARKPRAIRQHGTVASFGLSHYQYESHGEPSAAEPDRAVAVDDQAHTLDIGNASGKTTRHVSGLASDGGKREALSFARDVDQKTATELIHNQELPGRQIVVHGRVFRGARAQVIESCQFQS